LQMSLLKQKHFKLVAINSETFEKVDFLLFNPNPRQKKVIADSIEGLDLVIKIKRDKFRNQNKVQILVEDLVKHECKNLSKNR
ncbi:MAG: hypothetical protein L6Q37_17285, partial [Bdellovibrionaceae bacterium]|nr:hypothetical protein [Pseudobdellovibrionaceae bacterium]